MINENFLNTLFYITMGVIIFLVVLLFIFIPIIIIEDLKSEKRKKVTLFFYHVQTTDPQQLNHYYMIKAKSKDQALYKLRKKIIRTEKIIKIVQGEEVK